MSTYTYSITSDFGGNLNSRKFAQEIEADVTITTDITRIDTDGDVVELLFVSALSAGELTALNSLISGYSYLPYTKRRTFNSLAGNGKSYSERRTDVYWSFATIPFEGTTFVGLPIKITMLASKSGAGDISIKIVDTTNDTVIAEKTGISNTTMTELDMGTLSNISTGPALWDIEGKSSNNGKVRLSGISIEF